MNTLPQKIFEQNTLPKINKGQEALFVLVYEKLRRKEIIEHNELMYIYRTKVQYSSTWDAGHWDDKEKRWISDLRPYTNDHIEILMQSWLLRALGALIKKGYLTVIPTIAFLNEKKETINKNGEIIEEKSNALK